MTLPSGTVTFLFTDIEGSTKLAQGHPDTWESLQQRHHAILQSAIEAHNGHVFQIIGDAFCAAFHTASNGLNAAIEAQRKLQTENWDGTPVKVRMGLHTGSAELIGNEYHGYMTLARVQRVMSVAYGGQILLSNASSELIHNELPEGITLRDMKEHRLKGLLNPERLWQIVAPDLQQDFPPLQSLNEIPNNLPVQLTSFVGRENEITELKQELDAHRLVTLTGSGGTGKTRLSLQVATELLEQFDHGVWFIELAPLTDPDLIPQTILSAIGVNEQPNKTPLDILKEYLHEKKELIVLDNCEHLVTASAQVTNALLNAASGLKVLASSREALGVKGELSYPVPSLSLPDVKHLPTIEQLSQYESVRLFIDRALLVTPHFVVNKDNAPFIAQICYRLDGIPLAIELAAARVKMLSVEQISNRLDDRFRLLTGGARTALPRQQTLRALIDWSYDHLSENEQLLLRRLSVFAGGWTLEAAEDVCAGDGIESYEVLDLLSQLVNKSLVVVMEGSQSGETRYRMLETIRQYAREKLNDNREGETVRGQHTRWYVELAERSEPELVRSNQAIWLNRLEDEIDNFRTAIEWALDNDIEAGLKIIAVAWGFWQARGNMKEVSDWLENLLSCYDESDGLKATALLSQSQSEYVLDHLDQARILVEQALAIARKIGNRQVEALSLATLGQITSWSNTDIGISLFEESLALYRSLNDRLGQADVMSTMALFNIDIIRKEANLRESLRINRDIGNLTGIANCLVSLADMAIESGDFSSPVEMLEDAQSIFHQLGDLGGEAVVLRRWGNTAYWQGNYEQAYILYQDAIALGERVGHQLVILWCQVGMAYASLRKGDLVQARNLFEKNIKEMHRITAVFGVIFGLEGVASLKVVEGNLELATKLFSFADQQRIELTARRSPIEQASVEKDLVIIHSKVDDNEFTRLSADGRTMTVEQAIALALEV